MDAEMLHVVPTKAVGLFGSSFTWPAALMALLNVLVGGALVALIKNWPSLKRIAVERANSLDDERRADMDKMREDIALCQREAQNAKRAAAKLEMQLACAIPAVSILAAEVRKFDPNSPALKQAQDLIAMAIKGDLGFGQSLDDLAAMPGTKDEA